MFSYRIQVNVSRKMTQLLIRFNGNVLEPALP